MLLADQNNNILLLEVVDEPLLEIRRMQAGVEDMIVFSTVQA